MRLKVSRTGPYFTRPFAKWVAAQVKKARVAPTLNAVAACRGSRKTDTLEPISERLRKLNTDRAKPMRVNRERSGL